MAVFQSKWERWKPAHWSGGTINGFPWLGCPVQQIHYDFVTHIGQAVLLKAHCTDMTSVIRYFCGIDPQVQCIVTIAGSTLDTCYTRQGTAWRADCPDGWEVTEMEHLG